MPQQNIQPAFTASYDWQWVENPSELIVLLHGFQQQGALVLHQLEDCFDERMLLLAPDAPWPAPYHARTGYRLGYAWYFFNPKTATYVVDMSFSLEYLVKLIESLGYGDLPKRLVGYSMGGYLAPFLASRLRGVKQVVTINSRYRSEVMTQALPFRVDAIHGDQDPMVDAQRAADCHAQMLACGNTGTFYTIPGGGHKLEQPFSAALREVLALA